MSRKTRGSYDSPMPIEVDRTALRPGMRLALAVSGGADSVALLRAMLSLAPEIGLVLSIAHVHHGLRGADADADSAFVESLAQHYGLPFRLHQVDTAAESRANRETLEEAARRLRYTWFQQLLLHGEADALATAHTLDDQAETVLLRLLRGAWTEGLGGIHPTLACERGAILRPLLGVRRAEIEAWLGELGQPWREDASNADPAFTRNRVRHELLPQLGAYNPQILPQLAHLSAIARDEETYWKQEMDRLLPALLLPGRAVRGGGRAVSTHPEEASLGIEADRLQALAPAVRRRVLREAARRLGVSLNFDQVERLLAILRPGGPKREQLTATLQAERTPRELRLLSAPAGHAAASKRDRPAPVSLPIPGKITAEAYGLRIVATLRSDTGPLEPATLRTPQPGDRARLRHTSGKKPIKEIFARLQLDSSLRAGWPLIVWQGEVVWMQDVTLEPDPLLPFMLEVTKK